MSRLATIIDSWYLWYAWQTVLDRQTINTVKQNIKVKGKMHLEKYHAGVVGDYGGQLAYGYTLWDTKVHMIYFHSHFLAPTQRIGAGGYGVALDVGRPLLFSKMCCFR